MFSLPLPHLLLFFFCFEFLSSLVRLPFIVEIFTFDCKSLTTKKEEEEENSYSYSRLEHHRRHQKTSVFDILPE